MTICAGSTRCLGCTSSHQKTRNWRRRVRPGPVLLVGLFPQILVGHLSEPTQHVFLNWFISVEETDTAECHCAGVPENFPLPLRRLYCERRTFALDQLTLHKAAIDKVKSQSLEPNDSGHRFLLCQRVGAVLRSVQRRKARITSSREMIPASR